MLGFDGEPDNLKPNFDVFFKNSQIISSKTFHTKTYFAEFVYNLLSRLWQRVLI